KKTAGPSRAESTCPTITAGPGSPGVMRYRYQPAGAPRPGGGVAIVPSGLTPSGIRPVCTPMAGMSRYTGTERDTGTGADAVATTGSGRPTGPGRPTVAATGRGGDCGRRPDTTIEPPSTARATAAAPRTARSVRSGDMGSSP